MKKSFKLFLAAAFLVTEFFVIALPMLTTSARADGAIQAITHAGFGGGTDVTTRMMLLRARRVLKQDMQLVNKKGGGGAVSMDYMMSLPADGQHTGRRRHRVQRASVVHEQCDQHVQFSRRRVDPDNDEHPRDHRHRDRRLSGHAGRPGQHRPCDQPSVSTHRYRHADPSGYL